MSLSSVLFWGAVVWTVVALIISLAFAWVTPEKVVALVAKRHWGGLLLGVLRALGIDPVSALHLLVTFARARAENPPPQLVAELPAALQAALKSPALRDLLEGHAAKLLGRNN